MAHTEWRPEYTTSSQGEAGQDNPRGPYYADREDLNFHAGVCSRDSDDLDTPSYTGS